MRRVLLVAPVLAAAVAMLAGCGSVGAGATVPATVRAPPQIAQLGWEEPFPQVPPALVFGVSSLTVTSAGWTADISVENKSDTGWKIVPPHHEAELAFGLMLLPNDDPDEFDRLNRNLDLPAVRPATSYRPALPAVLRPGKTWSGAISAPGALPGGLWVRVVFGPFSSVGKGPKGVRQPLQWITDHAYHLEEVAAVPS
jgi:predicted small lipoprotein YifL